LTEIIYFKQSVTPSLQVSFQLIMIFHSVWPLQPEGNFTQQTR